MAAFVAHPPRDRVEIIRYAAAGLERPLVSLRLDGWSRSSVGVGVCLPSSGGGSVIDGSERSFFENTRDSLLNKDRLGPSNALHRFDVPHFRGLRPHW